MKGVQCHELFGGIALKNHASSFSSPTTKSLDPIVDTALRVGFPGESHGSATCRFACYFPEPEAWTTEASGQIYVVQWPRMTNI